jgi:hypothetical protein
MLRDEQTCMRCFLPRAAFHCRSRLALCLFLFLVVGHKLAKGGESDSRWMHHEDTQAIQEAEAHCSWLLLLRARSRARSWMEVSSSGAGASRTGPLPALRTADEPSTRAIAAEHANNRKGTRTGLRKQLRRRLEATARPSWRCRSVSKACRPRSRPSGTSNGPPSSRSNNSFQLCVRSELR